MNEHMKHLIGGAASLLALMPLSAPTYVKSPTEGRSDLEALRGDAAKIGSDLRKAMSNVYQQKA